MKEFIRQALGLDNPIYCSGIYFPPSNPTVNYFPFEKTELKVEFIGEWDNLRITEYKLFDNKSNKLLYHLIWKKGKDGHIYLLDKLKKKKWTDPNYRFKCSEDGFVFMEKKK